MFPASGVGLRLGLYLRGRRFRFEILSVLVGDASLVARIIRDCEEVAAEPTHGDSTAGDEAEDKNGALVHERIGREASRTY